MASVRWVGSTVANQNYENDTGIEAGSIDVDWYLYGKMEPIGTLGATEPKEISSGADGEGVNAGAIEIHPGHRMRGKVTLSNGAALHDGMRLTISSTRARDSQTVVLRSDGNFEFSSLASGKYEIFPSVRGYRLQADKLETTVDSDVDGFTVIVDPNYNDDLGIRTDNYRLSASAVLLNAGRPSSCDTEWSPHPRSSKRDITTIIASVAR